MTTANEIAQAVRAKERGLYALPCSPQRLGDIVAILRAWKDRGVFLVDGLKCSTRQKLFRALSETLGFPRYCGHNWDAFEECLSDKLEEQSPNAIIIADSHRLLASSNEDLKTLLEVFDAVSSGTVGTPIFFQVEPAHERSFVERLALARVTGIARVE